VQTAKKTRRVNPFLRAILWVFPPIYKAYMHLVFLTSKRVFYNYDSMLKRYDEAKSILVAIWHQDVLLITLTFRDYTVVMMVSGSDQEGRHGKDCQANGIRAESGRLHLESFDGWPEGLKNLLHGFCFSDIIRPKSVSNFILLSIGRFPDSLLKGGVFGRAFQ